MPRPSHRAERPAGRRWAPLLAGLLLVVGLATPVAVQALAGRTDDDPTLRSAAASQREESAPTVAAETADRLAEISWADSLRRPPPERKPEPKPKPKPKPEPEPKPEPKPEPEPEPEKPKETEATGETEPPAPAPFEVRVGSFNVLGSQHTAPGGDRQKYPPASVRTPAAANLTGKHGVDILGTQELQADQLRGMQSRTGMAAYPGFAWGEAETDNSVLWDPGVFELVSGSRFTITFMGRPRPQPIVRLRHRATGRELYVVNTHPSAGEGQYAAERRRGQGVLVGIVNDLKSSGLPVLVTGDMNDRAAFYCNVVPATGMSASNGGSYGDGCRPPPEPMPVDWVVGSGVSWSKYWRDTTPVDQRTSDHFYISATAHVG